MTEHKQEFGSNPSSSEENNKRIAIIDDEQAWLKTLNRMFKNSAYSVDTYENPEEFLEVIARYPKKYVGIICDIKMPQMDGYQVFQAVKQNQTTRNIPFLIVSGVLTQDSNITKVQGITYVSKLETNLREKIFEELIEVVENWPKLEKYLVNRDISRDKIETFIQFYINYHRFFNDLLEHIGNMEQACIRFDNELIAQTKEACLNYITQLYNACMQIINIIQDIPDMNGLVRKMCTRCRTSLTMIQTFQLLISEEPSSNEEFNEFLQECKEGIEKILIGTEQGYAIRSAEM